MVVCYTMEVLWCIFWILLAFFFYIFLQWRIKQRELIGDYFRVPSYMPRVLICNPQSDQNNIYNISGSVQGQNQHAYPDAYLSIDHIAITNELNKPPPKYDDAPPSYEEALKLAMAHSNSLQTYQSEQGHSADLPRTHLPAGSSID
ncbi:uncharacterized protein LOC126742867 isoform X4 [Anthonomus grandis grandis]|uniref:uncharacterized protein LOC126742867 isoform X4 n=1 Tax=Anthonomus grandis grandis TaxID=2921223 RepID=UPI0021652BD0|nr:uncharacterized protein LOC126742867 isoform X4 [Anthonomus grandis grandis]